MRLIPHTTSGYYQGFNLDFDIHLFISEKYGTYDNMKDLLHDVKEYLLQDHKSLRMNLGNLQRRFETLLSEMTDEIESVYKLYSTSLEEFASFSNGETIYKSVA